MCVRLCVCVTVCVTVCVRQSNDILVAAEDKVGYIKSRLVSGQIVPRSDLTAYRSYCVTALLIRHKLSKEAVVEFQVSVCDQSWEVTKYIY